MSALVLRAGLVLPMTPDDEVLVDGAVFVNDSGVIDDIGGGADVEARHRMCR